MLINVTINENNIITGWTKTPFSYDKPIVDLQEGQKIYVGFSQVTNPHVCIHVEKKVIDNEQEIEETHNYTCYDLIENKDSYEQDLKNKRLANKDQRYATLVEKLIREKYSISDEIAIIRQKDVKPEEYDEYYAYAEECKVKAKEELENE